MWESRARCEMRDDHDGVLLGMVAELVIFTRVNPGGLHRVENSNAANGTRPYQAPRKPLR